MRIITMEDIKLVFENFYHPQNMYLSISGDVDIGFSGSEATIYVYNGGEKDYLKTFAQLTQKDGSFFIFNIVEKKL